MSPELACIVISFRNQPGLVNAVQSVHEQEPRPDIVVVNSGGGDARASLREAGLDVRVLSHEERLLPGGARNAGIAATRAPFVAFLAADCTAEPGWVAARVRAHRAGAGAVASIVTNPYRRNRSATACHLLLFHRRLTGTPAAERRFNGLSYDLRLFDAYGHFRDDLLQGEDSEFRERLNGHVTFAWAPEVRTAHDNPRDPLALLRDQYKRGRDNPHYDELTAGPLLKHLLYRRPARLWRQAKTTPDQAESKELLRAWPLVAPAAAAYAAGVMRGRLRRPRSSEPTAPSITAYLAEELGA